MKFNSITSHFGCHLIPVNEEEELDEGILVEHIDDAGSRGLILKRSTFTDLGLKKEYNAWDVLWSISPKL